MSSVSPLSRRSYGVLMSRLVWPATILFGVTLCAVLGTILWTSETANRAAAERQGAQLTAAVEQKLADTRARLAQLAGHPGLAEELARPNATELLFWRFGQRAYEYFDFGGVFLIGSDGAFASGMEYGALAGTSDYERLRPLFGDIEETVRTSFAAALRDTRLPLTPEALERQFGITRLLADSRETYLVAAMPVLLRTEWASSTTGPKFYVAIAYRRDIEADLRKIAELHGIEGFRISTDPPPEGRAGLTVYRGQDMARTYLTWRPDRPGDIMRERLIPVTLFGSCIALALFLLVLLYIRWIAKDLARSEEKAQHLLGRDPLSGLPNRLLFAERLDQELGRVNRGGPGLALMVLDLDRFKDVNDTYGHQAGDALIKMIAQRLLALLRGADTLARFGGDEFAVIQTGLRSPHDAEVLGRRILNALAHSFDIAGTAVTVGASIGISIAPKNGTDRESLMRLADAALYQAKSAGRNRYSFFERQLDETIRMRKVVEDDLRQAIASDELVLHYQPIVSSTGGAIVGLEALVRWHHPKQGLISPDRFITLAEERGLIIPLGEWVLRRACEDGKRWPGLRIAVNVSPIQFRHRDFVSGVMGVLRETGFEASRLELELTEGVVVEDADAAEAAMVELRALGVNLALDDFGTGYSSLIYLRRFAFDKIKIDRSFLESMETTGESAILVHSIVHLGRALGLTVTAEGVETKEQQRFLQTIGCHQLQGFLFSRPVPAAEIDAMLDPQQGWPATVSAA